MGKIFEIFEQNFTEGKALHYIRNVQNLSFIINTFRASWFRRFSQKKQQFLVALPTS